MEMVGPKFSPWSLWVLVSKPSCFRIEEWSAASFWLVWFPNPLAAGSQMGTLCSFFLQSFAISCRIWQRNRWINALLDTLLAQWGFMNKFSEILFAAIFNKKFLWIVSQCQCFVFVYFLGRRGQCCKYVNVNNCQLSATSLSSVQPPSNTLNIKKYQIFFFCIVCCWTR